MTLNDRILRYIRRMEYASAEWDGQKLTLFGSNGTPWGFRAFNPGSYAREEFKRLEKTCARNRRTPFRLGGKNDPDR